MKKSVLLIAVLISVCMVFCSCGQKKEQTEVEDITRKEIVSEENTKDNKDAANTKVANEEKADTEDNKDEEDTEAVKKEEDTKETSNANETEKEDVKNTATISTKTLSDIREEIISTLGISGSAPLDADSASAIYGVDPADVLQAAGFVVMAGTFPHEVIMVEASSSAAAGRISSLFQVKLSTFTEQAKGYDASNYALAQKCKVEKNGNFVALFLSPDSEQIKGIYSKYIK